MALHTTLRELKFRYHSSFVCFRKPFKKGYKDWWLFVEKRLDKDRYLCRIDCIGTVQDGLVTASVAPYPRRRRVILPGYLPVAIPD